MAAACALPPLKMHLPAVLFSGQHQVLPHVPAGSDGAAIETLGIAQWAMMAEVREAQKDARVYGRRRLMCQRPERGHVTDLEAHLEALCVQLQQNQD